MSDQTDLFARSPADDDLVAEPVSYELSGKPDTSPNRVRTDDYATSKQGAASVSFRAGSQKAKLLEVYRQNPLGLTDEEAARKAEIPMRSCWWKRCNELRELGLITLTGQSRPGEAGVDRIVCRAVTS